MRWNFSVFSLLNIYLCRRVTRIQIGEKWIILIEVVCTGVLKIFYSTPTILSFKKPEVFKYCNYGYKIKPSLMWLFKFRLVLQQVASFDFVIQQIKVTEEPLRKEPLKNVEKSNSFTKLQIT